MVVVFFLGCCFFSALFSSVFSDGVQVFFTHASCLLSVVFWRLCVVCPNFILFVHTDLSGVSALASLQDCCSCFFLGRCFFSAGSFFFFSRVFPQSITHCGRWRSCVHLIFPCSFFVFRAVVPAIFFYGETHQLFMAHSHFTPNSIARNDVKQHDRFHRDDIKTDSSRVDVHACDSRYFAQSQLSC